MLWLHVPVNSFGDFERNIAFFLDYFDFFFGFVLAVNLYAIEIIIKMFSYAT